VSTNVRQSKTPESSYRNNRAEPPRSRLCRISPCTADGRTEFYVLPEVFHKDIAKGFEPQWLAQALLAHGLLYRAPDGKPQYPRRLPGMGVKRVYHFKAEILGEAGSDDLTGC